MGINCKKCGVLITSENKCRRKYKCSTCEKEYNHHIYILKKEKEKKEEVDITEDDYFLDLCKRLSVSPKVLTLKR